MRKSVRWRRCRKKGSRRRTTMRAVLIHSALHGLYLPINADASAETSFVRLCAPVLSRRARAESALSRSRARKSRGRAPLCAPDRVQRALEAPGEVTDGVRDRKQLRARAFVRSSCVSGVACAASRSGRTHRGETGEPRRGAKDGEEHKDHRRCGARDGADVLREAAEVRRERAGAQGRPDVVLRATRASAPL